MYIRVFEKNDSPIINTVNFIKCFKISVEFISMNAKQRWTTYSTSQNIWT